MKHLLYILLVAASLPAGGMNVSRSYVSNDTVTYAVTLCDGIDGLSQWHVTKIVQDATGMMWFGTWNGLNRYDGYQFTTFKAQPGDGNEILTDRVRDILIEDAGGGRTGRSAQKPGQAIYCRIDDSVFLFDTSDGTFRPVGKDVEARVKQRMLDDASQYSPKHDVTVDGRVIRDVTIEFRDRQGNLWLRTPEGVYKVTARRRPAQRVAAAGHGVVRLTFRDRQRRLWIGDRDARTLAVFTPELRLIGYLGADGHLHAAPVTFHSVYCMLHDSHGTLWIGTKPDGLFRAAIRTEKRAVGNGAGAPPLTSRSSFLIERVSPGALSSTDIYDLQEDRQGRLWVATFSGGLNLIVNPRAAVSSLRVLTWRNGLSRYPREAPKARRIILRADGTLIALTTTGLVVADNIYARDIAATAWRLHSREPQRAASLTNSAIIDAALLPTGDLLVATESGGVNLVPVSRLHDERLTFRHYTAAGGMISDIIQSVLPLDRHRVLLQQSNNLTVLDTQTGATQSFLPSFWGETLRFSDTRPIVLDNGRLLLSLENGAMTVPLAALTHAATAPTIAITEVSGAGMVTDYCVDHNDTIRLSPDSRSLLVRYAALDYRAGNTLWYQTSVDGSPWSRPTQSHELSLYNLLPGRHTVRIRSTNAFGQTCDNTRQIIIIAEPRFFETWYGKFLLWLLMAAVVAVVVYTYLYIASINRNRRETLAAYLALVAEKEHATISRQEALPSPVTEKEAEASGSSVPPAVPESGDTPQLRPRISADDEAFMQRLMDYVERNMGSAAIGVQEMADGCAMSRSSLNRRMHSIMGVTPADFLREARMKRACELLATTAASSADVAAACGFADPKYFAKAFKASQGLSPKEFRVNCAQ